MTLNNLLTPGLDNFWPNDFNSIFMLFFEL